MFFSNLSLEKAGSLSKKTREKKSPWQISRESIGNTER